MFGGSEMYLLKLFVYLFCILTHSIQNHIGSLCIDSIDVLVYLDDSFDHFRSRGAVRVYPVISNL